jgi:uncharacterized protein (DUF924 family)
MENPETIREFWFGRSSDDKVTAAQQSALWWKKHPETDQQIRQRFEPCMMRAAQHALDDWLATPSGRLALILLTDQFPRNSYRNSPQSFAFDPLALAWAREGITKDVHLALRPIERLFFYLPLEHSESLEDQNLSVLLCEELVKNASPEQKPVFAGFLDFALRHRKIIERFGRFPHRNQILGRASTPEEAGFLKEKGSSF